MATQQVFAYKPTGTGALTASQAVAGTSLGLAAGSLTIGESAAGAENQGIIQGLIDAIRDAGSGVLDLPPGLIYTKNISLTADKLHLKGQGFGSTRLTLADGAEENLIDALDIDELELTDLTLDGNRANQTTGGFGAQLRGVVQLIVDRVRVTACDTNGLSLENGGSPTQISTISNSIFDSNDLRGLWLKACRRIAVSNTIMRENTLDGCDIDDHCVDITFGICHAWLNSRNGLFIENDSEIISVLGGTYHENLNGINLNAQNDGNVMERITLVGPICQLNSNYGIRVRANVAGTIMRDILVQGAQCHNNTLGGMLWGSGPSASLSEIQALGGVFGDRQAVPTQPWGIIVETDVGAGQIIYPMGIGNTTGLVDNDSLNVDVVQVA